MRRVGLTGGIATGKSYVRRRFASRGVPTIDADVLARDVVARGRPAFDAIVRRFGTGMIAADGTLNRRRLAETVFGSDAARRDLEAIVHPAVYQEITAWTTARAAERPPPAYVVADIPLLYETGHAADFDVVVVTACAPEEQVRRVMARDGGSDAEARARLAAQWPIDRKVALADHVVRTDGRFEDTDRQVAQIHQLLLAPAG